MSERSVDWSDEPVEFLLPDLGRVIGLHNEDFCRWVAYNLGVDVAPEDLESCAAGLGEQQSAWVPETMLPAIVESVAPEPSATPAATTSPEPAATAEPTPKATKKPKPVPYRSLSKRAWQRLVKAPDRYVGKRYRVWACITQFDAATGEDAFRADASYKNWKDDWWLEGDNSMFMGTAKKLDRFVDGDIVWMQVESMGSLSYDTQIGGSTTVPLFYVDGIKRVKGSC